MQRISYYIAKGLRVLLQRPAIAKSKIDNTAKVCSGSQLYRTIMRRYSYIGHDCFINNAEIGSFCSIADGCKIGGASHNMDYVSTSPVFVEGSNILKMNFSHHKDTDSLKTIIENDVWIGMGCFVKEGVHIHNGAVVGMGSVVTHDVPPYEIWAGNPARKIRDRFDAAIAQKLEETRWWEYSDSELKKYSHKFINPEEFISFSSMIMEKKEV